MKVGQTVWLVSGGRGGSDKVQTRISKVGKKYFNVEASNRDKFYLTTLGKVSEFTTSTRVYLDLQQYEDEQEFSKLSSWLREAFSGYTRLKCTLDQLRRIKSILDES